MVNSDNVETGGAYMSTNLVNEIVRKLRRYSMLDIEPVSLQSGLWTIRVTGSEGSIDVSPAWAASAFHPEETLWHAVNAGLRPTPEYEWERTERLLRELKEDHDRWRDLALRLVDEVDEGVLAALVKEMGGVVRKAAVKAVVEDDDDGNTLVDPDPWNEDTKPY